MSTPDKIRRDERVRKLTGVIGAALSMARARSMGDGMIEDLEVRATGRFGLKLEWRGARYLVTVQELSQPYRPGAHDELDEYVAEQVATDPAFAAAHEAAKRELAGD